MKSVSLFLFVFLCQFGGSTASTRKGIDTHHNIHHPQHMIIDPTLLGVPGK
ncbi:hypothetical protein ES319_A08G072400v1 [Gossypium barbadense]|uniref:Uncharacterized protein n=1 Tax=Gossypium barbadense TaxID=3634 RepID=A0A5J5UQ11_GOSBA|nr:hypothetical protein ES319_A08G072400v1 [Gossypium barbadense]